MAAEHATKIYTVAIIGVVVIVAFLALTGIGHVIDAATQHFMLFYAGVFALIALCASVGLGLVATDRMLLSPGHRVFVQSAHRAASFGAVAFLIIHIVTEILAQRVHVLDAVVPFLSPFRTFYIGLGTIASDLILLLLITGIMRGRFNANGKAWRWRAIHYTSYVAFVFGVWHGLLGGRPGKPYVDWSYGFVVAFVLLGLAIRVLSNSLRPKESLSAPPVDMAANSASAPLRAAAMLAQYGGTRVGRTSILGASTGSQPVLSAPVSAPVLTALPAGGTTTDLGQPYYEPGYEGPPRYLGAPRSTGTGPMPRSATGPMPRVGSGPMPRATGPMPAAGNGHRPPPISGPMPRAATGPMPRAATGPMPRAATGPMPRAGSGPYPTQPSGPYPTQPSRPQSRTGPMPRPATGPHPTADYGWETGPRSMPPQAPGDGGPPPRGGTGPRPRPTGPLPNGTGPHRRPASGPTPRPERATPPYGYPAARGGRQDRQEWPDDGYDGNWYPEEPQYPEAQYPEARYPEDQYQEAQYPGARYPEPQWDGGFPETDPNLRYREPGPGMPGYRGSRDHRYGGDRY